MAKGGGGAGTGRTARSLAGGGGSLPAQSSLIIRRSLAVGRITVNVVEGDITAMQVDVIVNAANSLSFTPMDGGVSGALRNACGPAIVTKQEKVWWTEEGVEMKSVKLPTTQAGVQPTAGGLKDRGVQFIVHAVGPTWTDYSMADDPAFFIPCCQRIKKTVTRALHACSRVRGKTCALPAISGGIFTHWKYGEDIKDREQRAARRAVLEAVIAWARRQERLRGQTVETADMDDMQNQSGDEGKEEEEALEESKDGMESKEEESNDQTIKDENVLTVINICDLPVQSKGCVHMLLEEFDLLVAGGKGHRKQSELFK